MFSRHTLAHMLALAASFSSGCALFHERGAEPGPGPVVDRYDAGFPWGEDAARPPVRDAGPPPPTCTPADAQLIECAPECAMRTTVFWDGNACVEASCDCDGPDCGQYGTVDECVRDHARCASLLCGATGGAWHAEYRFCGSFVCGHPSDLACAVPTPACDCGLGRSFDPVVGCFDDPSCTRRDLCTATGGELASCDVVCDAPCPPPDPGDRRAPGCDCGTGQRFDDALGCVPDATCGATDDALCTASGGAWTESLCCSTSCGRPCPAACDAPACACGPTEEFEPGRGCVVSASCTERLVGESCDVDDLAGPLHCAPGLVCCNRCSGVGCRGPVCVAPCCGGDECDRVTGCATMGIAP